jgi:hypothetical protein
MIYVQAFVMILTLLIVERDLTFHAKTSLMVGKI